MSLRDLWDDVLIAIGRRDAPVLPVPKVAGQHDGAISAEERAHLDAEKWKDRIIAERLGRFETRLKRVEARIGITPQERSDDADRVAS